MPPLEAYLDSYDGYGGQGTLLSKFGIEEQDDLTLVVSRERYENYVTPLCKVCQILNLQLDQRKVIVTSHWVTGCLRLIMLNTATILSITKEPFVPSNVNSTM